MYFYYLKIFFKKNSPDSFNLGLIFPFIATILCSVIVLITYSGMNTLENKIVSEVTAINGYSRIYLESDEGYSEEYEKISNFLKKHGKTSHLTIEEIGYLKYNQDNHMPIKVIGLENLEQIRDKLNMEIISSDSLVGKILIGKELYENLNISDSSIQEIALYPAIDPSLSPSALKLKILDEKFKGSGINAIENISRNYTFIDYLQGKELFKYSVSFLSVNDLLEKQELDYINNNIAKIRYQEWTDIYPLFFEAVKIEKVLYTSFGFVLVLIASFNLYGLINLIIYRKKNQLSILLYQGMRLKDVRAIFVKNILIIGVFASLLGILISFLLVNTNIIAEFIPMLRDLEMSILIIPFSFIFNLISLYLFTHLSIKNNIKNIEVLKSNVAEN